MKRAVLSLSIALGVSLIIIGALTCDDLGTHKRFSACMEAKALMPDTTREVECDSTPHVGVSVNTVLVPRDTVVRWCTTTVRDTMRDTMWGTELVFQDTVTMYDSANSFRITARNKYGDSVVAEMRSKLFPTFIPDDFYGKIKWVSVAVRQPFIVKKKWYWEVLGAAVIAGAAYEAGRRWGH